MSQETAEPTSTKDAVAPSPVPTNHGTRRYYAKRSFDFMDTIVASVVKHGGAEHLDHDTTKLSLNTLNILAETTRVLAETERIEAARLAHAEQVPLQGRAELEVRIDPSKTQNSVFATERTTRQRHLYKPSNLFSGLAGHITWRELEDMSDERLEFLDKMLKRIVVKVCLNGLSWEKTGLVIYDELVEFGFQLLRKEGCRSPSWVTVADPKKSDLLRVVEAVDYTAHESPHWYENEMFQAVSCLMEARGFHL